MSKIICGNCEQEFDVPAQELDHVCPKSGFTPRDIEHYVLTTTPNAKEISEAAIKRGEEKKSKKK